MTLSSRTDKLWHRLRCAPRQFYRNLKIDFETRVLGPVLSSQRIGNVVMFHVGRSGSGVLGGMLHQHSSIYWEGELYQRHVTAQEQATGRPFSRGDHDQAIELLRKRMTRAGHRYFGCEVKFFHLDLFGMELEPYVKALDELEFTRFIILERKNHLRKIVSSVIAKETGSYHKVVSAESKLTSVRLDVERIVIDRTAKPLIEFLRDYAARFEQLRTLLKRRDVLSLTYEDDIMDDPRRAYERVCAFLNVPPVDPEPRYGRSNPYKLSELIINFDEVGAALVGTAYAWMLNDD